MPRNDYTKIIVIVIVVIMIGWAIRWDAVLALQDSGKSFYVCMYMYMYMYVYMYMYMYM